MISDGEKNMFSGLLICADCGHNLWYHFNQKNHAIKYFNCSGYNTRRGDCPTSHYIRVDFLQEVILHEIRRLAQFAKQHEAQFTELVMGSSQQSIETQRDKKRKELYALTARDRELDWLFSRMYEDNAAGKIDDDRFVKLSMQYTEEQKEIEAKIAAISTELDRQDERTTNADTFINNVKKHTRAKKLSEYMLNELIERIEVHQSQKIDGVHVQQLSIHYTCCGVLDIPETLTLPEIVMQTRQGVKVSYKPQQQAQ